MSNRKKFEWITRINEANSDENDVLFIEGLASTTESRDSYGTRPSDDILQYMLEKAPLTNLHLSHGWDNADLILNSVIGRVVDAEIRDETNLWIKASIVYPEVAEKVQRLLDNDVLLGFSIGGFFDISRDGEFINGELNEISLVSMPAVSESQGTVQVADSVRSGCFGAICRSLNLNNSLEDNNMSKNKKNVKRGIFSNKEDEIEELKTELVESLSEIMNNGFNDFKTEIIDDLKESVKKEVKDELAEELNEAQQESDIEIEDESDESDESDTERAKKPKKEDEDENNESEDENNESEDESSESSESDDEDEKKKKKGKKSERSKSLDQIKRELRKEILAELAVNRQVKQSSKIKRDLKKIRENKDVKRSLTPEEAAKLI